ncbi:MAG TPA: hypothetical protein VHZ97_07105 [Pseudonocardiaceae bacterium]|jgi:hypothetical protein|nr:hypothetical protein [Pseudonocardiaceae bacterium]
MASLVTLAACSGGGDSAAPQVASLPSSGSSSAGQAPTTTVTAGRPQERLDDSPQQHEALIHAWDVCLLANGATSEGATGELGDRTPIKEPIPKQAYTACLSKEPLGPPELDPNLNPNYRQDWLADISCLRSHGIMVHLTQDTSAGPNGLAWTFDDNSPPLPANEGQLENTCELSAFAGKK